MSSWALHIKVATKQITHWVPQITVEKVIRTPQKNLMHYQMDLRFAQVTA